MTLQQKKMYLPYYLKMQPAKKCKINKISIALQVQVQRKILTFFKRLHRLCYWVLGNNDQNQNCYFHTTDKEATTIHLKGQHKVVTVNQA